MGIAETVFRTRDGRYRIEAAAAGRTFLVHEDFGQSSILVATCGGLRDLRTWLTGHGYTVEDLEEA